MKQNKNSKKYNSSTVTPKELLEFGLEPAVLWNVQRERKIDKDILIVYALKNGYSCDVIDKLTEYFGADSVMKALNKHRDYISNKLFITVENRLKIYV